MNTDGSGGAGIPGAVGRRQPLPVEDPQPPRTPEERDPPARPPGARGTSPAPPPNRTHGPPLAFPSCNPVQPGPAFLRLTIGVGDANPALSRPERLRAPSASWSACPGPPDDSDVRAALQPHERDAHLGPLRVHRRAAHRAARAPHRPRPPGAAPHSTTMDFPFGFTVPCAPTPGSSLDASTCGIDHERQRRRAAPRSRTPTARSGRSTRCASSTAGRTRTPTPRPTTRCS